MEKGTVLNNFYRVVNLIGSGAMGHVYLVERIKDDKKFVVKEFSLAEENYSDYEGAGEIFFREGEFMARFSHEAFPRMHGIFSHNGKEYLTMDYIEGKTLEEIITSSSPLSEELAVKWAIELSKALDYLHNSFHAPIVYRDLKPSNIIITPEGKVKLVDFGIARYYNPDKNTDTLSYGSPGYAAPEQYKGKGQSTPQSDIFALGVILYEMLTKYDPSECPFVFPPMSELNPSVSFELEKIIKKSLQMDPLKRYISMGDFNKVLEQYIEPDKKNKKPHQVKPSVLRTFLSIHSLPLSLVGLVLLILIISREPLRVLVQAGTYLLLVYFVFYAFISIIRSFISKLFSRDKNERLMPSTGVTVFLTIFISLFVILAPNFLMARRDGMMCACESNLKNIAIGLEAYHDKHGDYPSNLNKLTEGAYIKHIPSCPAAEATYYWRDLFKGGEQTYPYEYILSKNSYVLVCPAPSGTHLPGYISPEGQWPQYTPEKGIEYKTVR